MTVSSSSTPGPASPNFDPPLAEHAADDKLSVTFSNVGYRHRWGNWALHNITHTFKPGTSPAFWEETAQESRHCWTSPPECVVPHEEQCPLSGMDDH